MKATTPIASPRLDVLLERLGDTRDAAGDAYESLRRMLCRYFEVRRAHDAAELSDEVIDRLARRLHEGTEIGDIGAFARGTARLVLLEARRRPAAATLDVETLAPPSHADGLADDLEAGSYCLDRCLARLDATARSQITVYYTADGRNRIEGRKRLALSLGVSPTALRLRMLRLRFALEQCMRHCLGDTAERNATGSRRTTP